MFDFLGSSWSSLMDMLPESLNPMNLIPDELNPFTVGQGLLEQRASLAPKISDYVREQMAKQASGLPLPDTTRFGTPIPEWARNPAPIVGQFDAQGNKIGLLDAMSGVRPALNQGIFAPNLPMGNTSGIQNILEAGETTEETEEEKRERLERARTLVEGLNEIAKSQQYNQPQIKPPTASAGTSAPAIQLTPTDMRTIAQGSKGGGVFGILGG